MVQLQTNEELIPAEELRDGDWVVGDFGEVLTVLRYQDSLVQGDFRPVLVDAHLLSQLGFRLSPNQPEGAEAEMYELDDFRISVINTSEYIFEGGESGKRPVHYLHLLQQSWRQATGDELAHDFLEQPHTIEVAK